jgi:hypothetical protein
MQKRILSKEIFIEAYNYMLLMGAKLGMTASKKRRGNK